MFEFCYSFWYFSSLEQRGSTESSSSLHSLLTQSLGPLSCAMPWNFVVRQIAHRRRCSAWDVSATLLLHFLFIARQFGQMRRTFIRAETKFSKLLGNKYYLLLKMLLKLNRHIKDTNFKEDVFLHEYSN